MKAVIYTDTLQWFILMAGLIFVTTPVALSKAGGLAALREKLPTAHFTLSNIDGVTFINWMVTIVPIWLVGMTLYQRMYACRNVEEARKAWYVAGLFEYPVMAFTVVFLGMCSRVFFPELDAEMGLPLLIREVLPIAVTGLVVAVYFSAIMSTADSYLVASSGNFVSDIIARIGRKRVTRIPSLASSMLVTMILGLLY